MTSYDRCRFKLAKACLSAAHLCSDLQWRWYYLHGGDKQAAALLDGIPMPDGSYDGESVVDKVLHSLYQSLIRCAYRLMGLDGWFKNEIVEMTSAILVYNKEVENLTNNLKRDMAW